MPETRVKGPASYFPSIEAKYGQPMEKNHGMGHGHANAAVAAFLSRATDRS